MYFNLKLKIYKSLNNSLRFTQLVDKSILNNIKIKSLISRKKFFGGRNHFGRLVNFRQGGLKFRKKIYTIQPILLPGSNIIVSLNNDANRSGLLCTLWNVETKQFFYSLASSNTTVGNIIRSYNDRGSLFIGHQYLLKYFPMGMPLFNLNNKYIKAAGTFGIIRQYDEKYAYILMPSGELVKILLEGATVFFGNVSNSQHKFQILGKAGRNRINGKRPTVRGIAMNPVDHPHGGRTNGGKIPVTPWGKPTRGVKTRKKRY